MGIVIVIVIVLVVFFFLYVGKSGEETEKKSREEYQQEMDQEYQHLCAATLEIAESHIDVLKKKYLAGVYKDEYGILRRDAWENSVSQYFKEVVFPRLNLSSFYEKFWKVHGMEEWRRYDDEYERILDERHRYKQSFIDALPSLIDKHVSSLIDDHDRLLELSPDAAKGEDFEYECMELLQDEGWSVDFTPKSGDQGVDLLAKKNSLLIAVQCKNYRTKVGNSAVQEVVAGRKHYNADYAVVVSASGFTKSAHELAASNGAILLQVEDLRSLESVLN